MQNNKHVKHKLTELRVWNSHSCTIRTYRGQPWILPKGLCSYSPDIDVTVKENITRRLCSRIFFTIKCSCVSSTLHLLILHGCDSSFSLLIDWPRDSVLLHFFPLVPALIFHCIISIAGLWGHEVRISLCWCLRCVIFIKIETIWKVEIDELHCYRQCR